MPFTIEDPAEQNNPQPATAPSAGAGFRLEMPNRNPAPAATEPAGFTIERPGQSLQLTPPAKPESWRDYVIERPPADDSWLNIAKTEFQNLPNRFENAYLGVMSALRNEAHDPDGLNKWLNPFKGYQAEARNFSRALRSDPDNPGLRQYAMELGADPDLLLRGDWRDQLEQNNIITQGFRAAGVAADEGLQEMLQRAQENTAEIAENTVDLPTWSAKGLARDTLVGVQEMAPAVLAGLATRSPKVGAAIMGSQAYAHSYLDALQEMELPHDMANERASIFALAEFATEAIPLKTILSDTKRLNKIMQAAYEEGIQEGVTEILQQGYDFLRLDEDITFPEFIEGVAHSVVVGAGVGGTLAAVTPGRGNTGETPDTDTGAQASGYTITDPESPAPDAGPATAPRIDPETGEITGGDYGAEIAGAMEQNQPEAPERGQLDEYEATAPEVTPEVTPESTTGQKPATAPGAQRQTERQVPDAIPDAQPENAPAPGVVAQRDDLPPGFRAVDYADKNRFAVETETKPENFRQLSAIARKQGGRYTRQKGYEPAFVFDQPEKREEFLTTVKDLDKARTDREEAAAAQPDMLAQESGQPEWQQFEPKTGSLGVPRAEMPQIKAEHRGAMVNFLKGKGIQSNIETVPAESLKPTQAEFSPAKVQKAVEYEGGERSILVSSDNHVVDGHHQWLAKQGGDIQIIRIDAPIKDLLQTVSEFPSAETSDGAESNAREGEVLTEFEESIDQFTQSDSWRQSKDILAIKYDGAPKKEVPATDEPVADLRLFTSKGFPVKSLSEARQKWLAERENMKNPEDGANIEVNLESVAWIDYDGRIFVPDHSDSDLASVTPTESLPAPEKGADPVKWFGTQEKADAWISKQDNSAEYTVTPNGKRFEVFQQPDSVDMQDDIIEPIPWEKGSDGTFMGFKPEKTRKVDSEVKTDYLPKDEAKRIVNTWKKYAELVGRTEDHSNEVVISLFDHSGEIVKPWVDAGYDVIQMDLKLGDDLIETSPVDMAQEILETQGITKKVVALLAQPPCTCFSSSGARWWKGRHDAHDKKMVEKMFGPKATRYFSQPKDYTKTLVALTEVWIERNNPDVFLMENPVGRIATEMGLPEPTLTFQPNNFGDPYTKKTQLWGKFNTDLPTANLEPTEGSLMHKLWSSAEKGDGLRSLTPEGFAYAFFMANNTAKAEYSLDLADNEADNAGAEPESGTVTDLFGEQPEATDDIPDNDQRDTEGAEPDAAPADGEVRGAAGRTERVPEAGSPSRQRSGAGSEGKGRSRKSARAADNDQDGAVKARSAGDRSAPDPRGVALNLRSNYRITDRDNLGQGGSIAKARGNLEAIRILKSLKSERREPTQSELQALVKYVGWGASDLANKLFPSKGEPEGTWKTLRDELKTLLSEKEYETAARSTQYAHYTSKAVIDSIWAGVSRLGLKNGMVFEGGMGTGNFTGLVPPSMNLHYSGVEMDGITAGIAKMLYPEAGVFATDFTKLGLPENYYDLTIGNPPFAGITILSDPKYRRHKFKLHDYFIAKQIDALKPGGLAVFVTSKGTMDKANQDARQYLADRVDLLGAIRLPQTAFKENAGTEVVTDILFFQKREEGAEPGRNAWLELKPIQTPEGEAYINEYFHDNPKMVLGDSSMKGSMYGPAEYTVLPNGNIEEQLAAAVKSLPQGVYQEQQSAADIAAKAKEFELSPGKTEGSYYFDDDGVLRQVTGGVGEIIPVRSATQRSGLPATALKIITSYVPLRDAVLDVYAAQNDPDALAKAQAALHTQYDQFVKKHGPINRVRTIVRKDGLEMTSEPVLDVVYMDPFAYQVAMIEKYDEATGETSKHQIFYEQIKTQDVTRSIESAVDALSVTLNDKGYVDLDYLAELYNTTPEAALAELDTAVYQDPATDKYVTEDDYLSGNVKAKLALARQRAEDDKQFQRNVKALEEVQPEDLPLSRIPVNLGAMWIPSDLVQRFAEAELDFTGSINSFISGDTSNWAVTGTSENQAFATNRRKATDILAAALNRTTVKVYDTVYDGDKKTQELNKEETAAANQKVQELKDKFQSWILNDTDAADTAHEIYNARFNTTVPRKYNGAHLTLPRLSSRYTPHAWQKNAVWRVITNGNTYMAHTVGSGKTLTSAIAAMELKRLGLAKKPAFSVLKSTLKQFAMEFLDAYPDAKVLIADERQLDRRNLKKFYARLTSENWDAVILSHQAFEKIPLSNEFVASVMEDELDEYRALLESVDEEDRAARKQIERQVEAMEERLDAMSSQDRKIVGIPFEETGIDFLFVDEAHHHKKIPFPTNQSNIKGVDPNGSNIAYDMFLKSKYLNNVRPGRAITLMSGTPVTNTVGEVFNIQRYLQPEVLKSGNVSSFDTWSATFTTTVTELEMQPSGTFKPSTRLAKFVGVPALMRDFLQVADVVTDADLNESLTIKRPAIRGGQRQIVTVPRSPELKEYQASLATRIQALENKKGPPKKGEDNILVVIGDAKKASIDLRLVGLPQNTPSKLDFMIEDVFKSWRDTKDKEYRSGSRAEPLKGATQLIFTEIRTASDFDIYDHIKTSLVRRGVPADQIAFIQDYNTTKKKKKLFREMNTGAKRILLGGSKNLGTGTNVQQRLYDLNHLDIDYLPANIVQREGRAIRQGNKNEDVGLRAYATEGTVDAFMWQLNETKQRMIDQVMSGNLNIDEVEDISDSASQMAQAKALSSGNPLLLEQAGLSAEVTKLRALRDAHRNQTFSNQKKVKALYAEIAGLKESLAAISKISGNYRSTVGDKFKMTIFGKTFNDRTKAGDFIQAAIASQSPGKVGSVAGFNLSLNRRRFDNTTELSFLGENTIYSSVMGMLFDPTVAVHTDERSDSVGLIKRLENQAKKLADLPSKIDEAIQVAEKRRVIAEQQAGTVFQYSDDLKLKENRLAEIDHELAFQPEESQADQSADDNFKRSVRAPNFYSAMLRTIEQAAGAPRTGTATQWQQWLNGRQLAGEIRKAERDWLGVDAWLDSREVTTRQELGDYVRSNQIQIEDSIAYDGGASLQFKPAIEFTAEQIQEFIGDSYTDDETWLVFRGAQFMGTSYGLDAEDARLEYEFQVEENPEESAAGYDKYVEAGGENYRELLLRMPLPIDQLTEYADNNGTTLRTATSQLEYRTPHWAENNVLVHVRFNERNDAAGNKTLFLEEIQSDWHQRGRQVGYFDPKKPWEVFDPRTGKAVARFKTEEEAQADAEARGGVFDHGLGGDGMVDGKDPVPDAPFKSTDDWSLLALKRMVRWAAEHGINRIAWTTGGQQARRYDLSKQVSRVTYTRGRLLRSYDLEGDLVMSERLESDNDLTNFIGKEAAQNLLNNPIDELPESGAGFQIEGADLKVGGAGMIGYYDEILPKAVNKWAKKFGGKVEKGAVIVGADGELNHVLEITPMMRDAALQGLPLFSRTPSRAPGTGRPQIEQAFKKSPLAGAISAAIKSGRIVLHDTGRQMPGWEEGTQAITMPDGTIHLAADQLRPNEAVPVLMHEAFHSGGQAFLGTKAWKQLNDRLSSMYDQGARSTGRMREFWQAAQDRIANAEKAGDKMDRGRKIEEFGAYVIEEYERAPRAVRKWFDDLIAAIKKWMLKFFGTQVGDVTPGQLASIAASAIRSARPQSTAPTRQSASVRRSVRRDEIGRDIAKSISEGRTPTMLQKMGWKIIDYRSNGLYFLGRNHLVEIGSKVLPTMNQYLAQAKRMDAYRNRLLSEKSVPADSWREYAKANKVEAQELSELMHDATIAGVDPAENYEPITDPKTVRENIKVLKQKARDRSGENTAKWMDLIRQEKNKLKQERNRAQASGSLYARWNKLSPAAKEIYVTVRDAYAEHQSEVLSALIMRIEENISSEKHRRALIDALRVQFENNKVHAPYFPLSRFGEYWVRVNDISAPMNEPDYSFHMFESKSEQETFRRSFENDPTVTVTHGKKLEAHKEMARISPGFVTDVQLLLDQAGSGPKITAIKDEVYQLYLTSLPDLSVRKHFIHRGSIKGYSQDAIRAFSHFMFHGSYQLARLKYAHRLENLLEEMRADIGIAGNPVAVEDLRTQAWLGEPGAAQRVHNIESIETDPDAATDFLNELQKRHDWAMNPSGSKTAQFLTSFGFLFYLGVSPAAAMVNLTQTPIVALPVMGSKWGMAKSTAALGRAMTDFFRGGRAEAGFSVNNVLTGDEKAAFQALEDSGILDKTLGHDLAGMSEQGFEYNSTAHRVMNVVSFFFHHAERFNREITALASYRLARAAGKSHMAAVQAAADVTETSHFDYSSSNKARLLHSDTARVLLLFRQYSLNVTYLLARSAHQSFKGASPAVKVEARRRLAGILGMTSIFAGLSGLPMFWVVKFVLETMFDDEDEPWDFDAEFRQGLYELTGSKTAAAILARGPVDMATGATVSSRVSLNDLWIRDSYRELEGQAAFQYWLEQIAGPIGGTGAGAFRWAQLMEQGEFGRAFEALLPVFMRNSLKAWRFHQEGANSMRGDPLIEEVPNGALAMQVLGFTPTMLSERYAENSAIKNVEQRILDRRSKLLDRYALTTRLEDAGGIDEVLIAIGRFNTANPTVAIKNETLIQSLKSRQNYSTRAQDGIILNRNLQHLGQKYDFSPYRSRPDAGETGVE